MKYKQLAAVLISVMGVYFFSQGLFQLSFFFSALVGIAKSSYTLQSTLLFSLLGFSLYGSVGLLLIFFSRRLVNFIIKNEEDTTCNLEIRVLQSVGFSILGIYFAVDGLSLLRSYTFYDYRISNLLSDSGFIRLIFGVVLFFGARGLANIWNFARRPGTHNKS